LSEVTITDPAHPLFGRTFPLVQHKSPRGKSQLIIQLPNGLLRSVPHSSTNLSTSSLPTPCAELPAISVWTILPLARFIQNLLQAAEEISYGNSIDLVCSQNLSAESGADLSGHVVESIESRTTETGSQKIGRAYSTDADTTCASDGEKT
jgi:hypothetical protein